MASRHAAGSRTGEGASIRSGGVPSGEQRYARLGDPLPAEQMRAEEIGAGAVRPRKQHYSALLV